LSTAPQGESPREAWQREQADWDDWEALAGRLAELRRLVPPDSELADLQRQAVRARLADLPLGYVGAVVLSFYERWLELSEATEPTRPYVEAVTRRLRPLAAETPHRNDRQVVHYAAEFARQAHACAFRPRYLPSLIPGRGGLRRREGRRDARPGPRRSRVRSGSRGDPPDESDHDELGHPPGIAGPIGVPVDSEAAA
jgi:hypothetical protein